MILTNNTRQNLSWKQKLPYIVLGGLFLAWFAILLAPCLLAGNLFQIADAFNVAITKPFSLSWCSKSLVTLAVIEGLYLLAILYYSMDRKNYRRGEEYGSAKWTTPQKANKYLANRDSPEDNRILSDGVVLDTTCKKVNLNTVVVGGSGAGKTWRYVKPNLMQANTSFVVLDPKGENLASTGNLLKAHGYDVRVLNLLDMEQSDHYNPFKYLTDDNSVQTMVTNIFKATSAEGGGGGDMKFWEDSAQALFSALVYYLWYFTTEEDQTFANVMFLLREAKVKESNENYISPVDAMFDAVERQYPGHIAIKYWRSYKVGSGKTLKSIQATLASHLEKFNLDSLARLTSEDDMNLTDLGTQKVAIFALIPDMDTSFNFLVSVLYSQLFQQLEREADAEPSKHLQVPVHFLMDEFANVALPKDFDKILSVIRSRWISVSIILQNISQLKALYKDSWESIIGNCDEFIYLGGNEQSTHEYVSKLLGKETIDHDTHGRQHGSRGSYSTNYQDLGRELLTPDEVGNLSDEMLIMRVRGCGVILDKKYQTQKHSNFKEFDADGTHPFVWSPKEKEQESAETQEVTAEYERTSQIAFAFSPEELGAENAKVIDLDEESDHFTVYSPEELNFYVNREITRRKRRNQKTNKRGTIPQKEN